MNNIVLIISIFMITTAGCKQVNKDTVNPVAEIFDENNSESIAVLKESGIITKPVIYVLQTTSKLKFNNDTILINIYATYNIIDNRGQIDSLVLVHNDLEQTIRLWDDICFLSPHYLLRNDLIEIEDYNFDGFADISVYNDGMSGTKNKYHNVYLYDPKKRQYFYHRELSEMLSLSVNKDTKTIGSWSEGGMASQIFWSGEYKWEKGNLVLIHSVEQDYIAEPLNSFIRKTSKLQNDTWIIQTDTLHEIF